MNEEKEVLTIKDLCEFLEISTSTLNRMLKRGEIPARKVGNSWRFSLERIREWLHDGNDKVSLKAGSTKSADSAPLKKGDFIDSVEPKREKLSEKSELKREDYFTTAEASALYGVSTSTLKLYCKNGKFSEAVKRGKTWYLLKSELEEKIDKPFDKN